MSEKNDLEPAGLLALGVSRELVKNFSAVEAKDLLQSLLYLQEKYQIAASRSV